MYLLFARVFRTSLFLVGVLGIASSGCRSDVVDNSIITAPPSAVSFQSDVLPIFRTKCSGCHVGSGTSGVSLSNFAQVTGSIGVQYGTAIVEPGDSEASPLVDKLLPNPQFGQRMPEGSQLSASQISTIRTWIDEGANDN